MFEIVGEIANAETIASGGSLKVRFRLRKIYGVGQP
jgi:hypothetical protein